MVRELRLLSSRKAVRKQSALSLHPSKAGKDHWLGKHDTWPVGGQLEMAGWTAKCMEKLGFLRMATCSLDSADLCDWSVLRVHKHSSYSGL